MARATTKKDLVDSSQETYDKLMSLIESMSDIDLDTPMLFDDKKKEAHWHRDKNLRDVVVHMYEWHQLLIDWISSNQSGNAQPFIPKPYNWRTYGEMNVELWKKHQDTSLKKALSLFQNSHEQVMALVETFSNDDLFTKGVYEWVGGSTLGSYFVSATSSHYEWAMKKLRAHIKVVKSNS